MDTDLKNYCEDMDRRVALAKRLKTSPMYLWQLANKWRGRRPGPKLAQRIEQATADLSDGSLIVRKESMRSDLWPTTQAA